MLKERLFPLGVEVYDYSPQLSQQKLKGKLI